MPLPTAPLVDQELANVYGYQRHFARIEEIGSLTLSVINSLLPLLFGFIGACAYVARMISEQIKDSTFSGTSPARNWVRMGLGALVGAVVGFGWFLAGINASILALAFIGGYSIEPVFATIDSIGAKFKQGLVSAQA